MTANILFKFIQRLLTREREDVNVNINGRWLNSIFKVTNPSIVHFFYAKIMHRKFFLSFLFFFTLSSFSNFLLTRPRVCFSFVNRKIEWRVKQCLLDTAVSGLICTCIHLPWQCWAILSKMIFDVGNYFLRKYENYSLMYVYSNGINLVCPLILMHRIDICGLIILAKHA